MTQRHVIDEAGKVPAAAFFSNPTLRSPVLSPDGTRIAGIRSRGAVDSIIVFPSADSQGERELVIEKRGERSARTSRRISMLGWPSNEHVVYSIETPLRSKEDSWKRSEGGNIASADKSPPGIGLRARKTRLYVADLEGKKRWLGKRWPGADRSQSQSAILSWLPDDPEHLLVQYRGDAVRVRLATGSARTIQPNRGGVASWVADHEGQIRISGRFRDWTTERSLHARRSTDSPWQKLIQYDRFEEHGFWSAAYSGDPDFIYVYSDRGPEGDLDKIAVFEFDLQREVLGRKVLDDPEYDIDSGYLLNSPTDGRLLAIYHYKEGLEIHFVDEGWRRLWDRVIREFPGQDVDVSSWDATGGKMLLSVSSDRSPPSVYLYDSDEGRIERVSESYPELRGIEFAAVKPVRFEARDGREIRGYVTRPVGQSGPGATIVYPHDGPADRDSGGWDSVVQFLVQRGFAVFQLNFRGSTGYGREHERAGDHEWGGRIQDDITDGVRWLVAQGIADPDRVGIFGQGFGGYSALMGLVKTPELYKAGAALGAITDIFRLMKDAGRYFRQGSVNEHRIGSAWADRARLVESSPARQASRIRAPVLLGHGTENPSVHQSHTDDMARALRQAGATVEAHLYRGATRIFLDERDRIDFYRRLADFFERHLLMGPFGS